MNKKIEWFGEGTDEIGKIDDEVIIRVSKEFYRPDNTTVLVGDTTNLKNLGWTMDYDIYSLIEEMIHPQQVKL
jgi:GDP-D-mannose dehydratase